MEIGIYEILILCGVPALISGLIQLIVRKLDDKVKSKSNEEDSVKLGLQALLRRQLLQDAKIYLSKGYCSLEERGAFEAMYNAYHGLGKNGVMDQVVNSVLALPITLQIANSRKDSK